ncbi:MAG: hypothetical protein M3Y81_11615 [Chloroflexota bacterium]|nr:hypothetical protein [Chloroflexota bacterium]
MSSSLPYERYPIKGAAAQIYQGEDPWYALGCFEHDWWGHAPEHRVELIAEPPPPAHTPEEQRWAAFCAAVVEELCERTNVLPPSWTVAPQYVLEEPWFYEQEDEPRAQVIAANLASFTRHNVFVSPTVLDNKYEFAQMYWKPGYLPLWTEEEMQRLVMAEEEMDNAFSEEALLSPQEAVAFLKAKKLVLADFDVDDLKRLRRAGRVRAVVVGSRMSVYRASDLLSGDFFKRRAGRRSAQKVAESISK